MKKYVYSFGGGTADGDGKMKDMLGGKGAGLAEMSRAGCRCLPASPFRPRSATSTSTTTTRSRPKSTSRCSRRLGEARKAAWARSSATPTNPLLVSVRSGAKFSMPGMMDTILNLGLNDETVEGAGAKSDNPRFAYDCYRRFIQMFGNVVLEIPKDEFDDVFDGQKKKAQGEARHRPRPPRT